MYSVLFSKIEFGMDLVLEPLKKVVKPNSKVAIFPWAFPIEITSEEFENDYFQIDGRRYNKYFNELKKLGINKKNIIICNPYKNKKKELQEIIKNSDILLFPGGNPEMFFKKVLHDTELIYDFKYYKGIVIGESAGTELQLKRYFITSKNNYYKYFAFYDGFGLIDNDFFIDVHTQNNITYLNELKEHSNNTNSNIYAIFDDGALIYNRKTNNIEQFGNIMIIEPNNND
ncbi:MAG: Type 1 glutamine amidotransferase-like domain-containing protein [Bacilli bacterium]|nr:Type 1 glutamine amidotransferase-like domain-containing protein [Bacilli bacterium]MDD4795193.1 Type 1 glutamine amidotransferase-like domain-containing protein [Bacilli bacterium]